MSDEHRDESHDVDLVPVFKSNDLGSIAMAEGILEGAEIEYLAHGEGIQDLFGLGRLTPVNPITGRVTLLVAAENEERARILLGDIEPPDQQRSSAHGSEG